MAENQGSPFRTCRKCNQPFSTKSAFFLHWEDCKIATTTRSKSQKPGKETPPASAPSLRCDLCNQSFQDSNGLRMHKSSSKKHKSRLPPPKSTLPQSPPIKVQGIVGLVGSSSSIPMDGTFATSGIAIPYFPPAPEPSATDNPPITTKTPSPVIQKPNVISPQMPRPPATELNHISKDQSWTMLSPLERIKLWNELQLACHTTTDLSKNGYMLAPISSEELNSRRKCQNCGYAVRYILKWDRSNQCHYHPGLRQKINGINIYKCCNRSGPGCKFQAYHSYTSIDSRLLNQNTNLITAPPAFISLPKRRVVALDCEMVSVQGGATELALLCAIDVLTSEILIHKYIKPDKRITDYRTKWSGVTPAKMNEAVAKNQAYFGWKAARTALLSYIDNETILVGHALHHDLQVLNLIHTRCVDSGILAKNVSGGKRQWGLKGLSDQLLSRDIQNHGKKGHDCLEDTMATREVTIYCLLNREKFEMWGQGMRVIEEEKMRIAKEARDKKMRKKTEKNAAAAKQSDGFIERYNEMDLEEYVSDEYDEYDDLNHLV